MTIRSITVAASGLIVTGTLLVAQNPASAAVPYRRPRHRSWPLWRSANR
ncbi:hypothetical protein ACFQX7_35805 [Luedemannella flava]